MIQATPEREKEKEAKDSRPEVEHEEGKVESRRIVRSSEVGSLLREGSGSGGCFDEGTESNQA